MQILIDSNNVVVSKGNIEIVEQGHKVNGTIYGHNLELTLVETELLDKDIVPQRDKIENGIKKPNVSHQNFINEEKEKARNEVRQQVKDAEKLGNISEKSRTRLIENGILEDIC